MLFVGKLALTALLVRIGLAGVIAPHIDQSLRGNEVGRSRHELSRRADFDPLKLYKAHNFSVPVDHFQDEEKYEPHSNATFPIRYWYDATYYKLGGPVIALASGETSGEDRLPFLQKGIVNILAKATNGIGVILEHRYYGTSFPFNDLSLENMRFLTTEQALADAAYLAENIVFEGLEEYDLTSADAPWILYGGSYAGGFVAFLRLLYPDTFWGAISSSGVTKAIIDYWQYWEPIRLFGPQDCVHTTQDFVEIIDSILIDKKDSQLTADMKSTFGLPNITYDNDFVATLMNNGIGAWQGRNWDPAVSDKSFDNYCGNITTNTLLYSSTAAIKENVQNLTVAAGYPRTSDKLITRMLNWIGYVNATLVTGCADNNRTQDQCYSTHNDTFYAQTDLSQQAWRSWAYQYCTEWGYYQTGSGIPPYIRPIVSRTLDVEYGSIVCRSAFNITTLPDVGIINKYGGFNIKYPRLAFIDGQVDPWRYAGTHAAGAPKRRSTWQEPFIQIEGAVHHWDENGLFANETTAALPPAPVKAAQGAEVAFVRKWLAEYRFICGWNDEC